MSTFQRTQYVEIAKVIAKLDSLDDGERAYVAGSFAIAFLKDNPRFNEKRFYAACNLPGFMQATLAGIARRAQPVTLNPER